MVDQQTTSTIKPPPTQPVVAPPASIKSKKSGVTLRDSSKLQLIQRNNSQASGLNLQISTERMQPRASNTSALVTPALSQRSGKAIASKATIAHQLLEQSRSSIPGSTRRQQNQKRSIVSQQPQNPPQQEPLQAPVSLRDFHVLKKIGVGAYSEVYSVTRKSDGIEYALKQVKIQRLTEKEKQNALNEVRILASISNKNVIAYKEAFFDEESHTLCIVMEFADSGDLYTKIMAHQKNATEFPEREIWDALVQMTAGLKTLHARHILHRDLKSANIFWHSDGSLKLGDLNVSKIAQDGMLYTQTGTPYYASPEVWQEKPYDSKSDIWSLGCIIYEMCALNPPFRAKSMKGLYNSVLSGMYPKLPEHYSEELCKMIKLLLQVNPAKRPNCDQLLQHELIVRYYQNAHEQGFGAALALISEQQITSIHDQLLQTIHCPRNLSQLSQILPRSNYQSGVDRTGNQELDYVSQMQHPPQTAETAERRRKRKQKTQELTGDRNQIIELAQQIILPPIRDNTTSASNLNAPSILQQQQQRQLELLNLRRQKTKNKAANAKVQSPHKVVQDDHQNYQQQPSAEQDGHGQQIEKKKKIKTQLQIRQQINRIANNDLRLSAAQRQNMHMSQGQAASTLSNYQGDNTHTLAAQLDVYSSSQIELPPSIENLSAFNEYQPSLGRRQTQNSNRDDICQYASQANLVLPNSSLASAHRYQSVEILNGTRDGQAQQISTAGAVPPTQIKSGGGNTSLPGLKQNLQSIKSAKQLQKLTTSAESSQNAASMRAIKSQQVHESAQSQLQADPQNRLGERLSAVGSQQLQPHQSSQAQLPPRQPSTTRNGGPTRNQQQKLKSSSNVTMSQRNLAQNQQILGQLQQKAIGMGNRENTQTNGRSPQMEKSTPAQRRNTKISPQSMLSRRQTLQTAASQKRLHPEDLRQQAHAAIMETQSSMGPKINTRAVQASVDVNRLKQKTDLMQSLPKAKISARQQKDPAMSVIQSSKDKGSIMVELQTLQGNSGRNSIQGYSERNNVENFSQNMQLSTSNQENMRMNQGKSGSIQQKAQIHGLTMDVRTSIGLKNSQYNSVEFEQAIEESEKQHDEDVRAQVNHSAAQDKQSSLKSMRLQQRMQGKKVTSTKIKNSELRSATLKHKSVVTQSQEANLQIPQAASFVHQTEVSSFELKRNTGDVKHLGLIKSVTNSKQRLPSLKTNIDSEENGAKNRETNQSRQFKELVATPQMTNLERNKQQLEKLRQLASVRQQKKKFQQAQQQSFDV